MYNDRQEKSFNPDMIQDRTAPRLSMILSSLGAQTSEIEAGIEAIAEKIARISRPDEKWVASLEMDINGRLHPSPSDPDALAILESNVEKLQVLSAKLAAIFQHLSVIY